MHGKSLGFEICSRCVTTCSAQSGKSRSQTLNCTPRRGCKYLGISSRSRSQSFTTLRPFLIELTGSLFPRQCITGSSAPATGPFEYQALCELNSWTTERIVVLAICEGLCITDLEFSPLLHKPLSRPLPPWKQISVAIATRGDILLGCPAQLGGNSLRLTLKVYSQTGV